MLSAILFAISISWARAIREVILVIIPTDANSIVLGEVGAASVTTILGIGLAIAIGRCGHTARKRRVGTTGAAVANEARVAKETRTAREVRPVRRSI